MATYDEYYRQYYGNPDTSSYDKMKQSYNASVDADSQAQIQKANQSAQGQLRDAYVQRVQNERKLADSLARSGIRGGTTETSNLRLANEYGRNVGTINTNLSNSVSEINRTAEQNKLAYAQELDAKRQQYLEDRQAEARQAARDQVNIDFEKEQTQRQQDYDRYVAWASKFYDSKKLKAELKKAKAAGNTLLVQAINTRIGYLKSHKKGY